MQKYAIMAAFVVVCLLAFAILLAPVFHFSQVEIDTFTGVALLTVGLSALVS